MALPSYAVDFRGFPACPCQAEWLPVFERVAQRRGLIPGAIHLFQLIGGAVKSGGTHVAGGADDMLYAPGLVALSREMGADATWHRPFNWDGDGGSEHIHRVLRGCPHNGPARYQLDAVDDGFNGLGLGGRGGLDDGPRPLSLRTWREGIDWALQQEALMVTPEDEQKIRDIFREELASFGENAAELVLVKNPTNPTGDKWKLGRYFVELWKQR